MTDGDGKGRRWVPTVTDDVVKGCSKKVGNVIVDVLEEVETRGRLPGEVKRNSKGKGKGKRKRKSKCRCRRKSKSKSKGKRKRKSKARASASTSAGARARTRVTNINGLETYPTFSRTASYRGLLN